jgi:N utilization substance protein B
MTRRESREMAFILLFEKTFTDSPLSEIIRDAGEARELNVDSFATSLAEGADEHTEGIDVKIYEHSTKWSKGRISHVALAIMRLALYEMLFMEDIPVSVSINEAVELAKKYGGEEDSAFINGVLGGISREHEE